MSRARRERSYAGATRLSGDGGRKRALGDHAPRAGGGGGGRRPGARMALRRRRVNWSKLMSGENGAPPGPAGENLITGDPRRASRWLPGSEGRKAVST